jgi:hypothetical protein
MQRQLDQTRIESGRNAPERRRTDAGSGRIGRIQEIRMVGNWPYFNMDSETVQCKRFAGC